MRLLLVLAALAFGLGGLLVPPEATVRALTDAGASNRIEVEQGVWILKALLLAHAVAAALLARMPVARGDFEPLLTLRGPAPDRPRAAERAIITVILLVAAALRRYDLGDQLWYDEIRTLVQYVRTPLGHMLTTFDSQNQHLLYSVLARIAIAIAGESNAALRLPAAIFGVASLWALWGFARTVTDRREALFAASFVAVSYHHVWFSQDARGYTGLLFFTLLGTAVFLRMLTSRRPRGPGTVIAYGLTMSLAVATHVTALFVVVGHGLLWLALLATTRRQRLGANRWMPAIGFALTASLSLLFYALVLPQLSRIMLPESLGEVANLSASAMWIWTLTRSGLVRGVPGGWIVLVPGAAIVALGVLSILRRSVWLLALYLLGVLVMLAVILALQQAMWPRYFFFGAGFFVLILFRGLFALFDALSIGSMRTLAARAGLLAAALLCLVSAATVPRAYGPKQDFVGALGYLRSTAEPGDAVATTWLTSLPYQALFRADWPRVDSPADLQALEATHKRTWVVYTMPELLSGFRPEMWRRLHDDYEEAKVFPGTVGGGEVVVRVRR